MPRAKSYPKPHEEEPAAAPAIEDAALDIIKEKLRHEFGRHLPPLEDPAWDPIKDWVRRELEMMHAGPHGVFVNNEQERRDKNP